MFVTDVVSCVKNFILIGASLRLLLQNVKGLTFLGHTVYRNMIPYYTVSQLKRGHKSNPFTSSITQQEHISF